MKKIIKILLSVILTSCLFACSDDQKKEETSKFETNIEVTCRDNLILSRYDVRILVDNEEIGILEHGETNNFIVDLENGSHNIRFENEEDSSVDGSSDFSVDGTTNLKFYIHCHGDQIDVNMTSEISPPLDSGDLGNLKYEDVKSAFEDAGFTNISDNVVKDLTSNNLDREGIVTNIKINGDDITNKDSKYFSDSEVIVEYHIGKTIMIPEDICDYYGKNYLTVKSELEDLGFKNIEIEEIEDSLIDDGKIDEVIINGKEIDEYSEYSLSDDVVIKIYRNTSGNLDNQSTKVESEYELAFEKSFSSYSLYLMFDTDKKEVAQFGTDDTYLYHGNYSGDLSNGVTINWDHGQYTEKFAYKEDTASGKLTDPAGTVIDYYVCDINTAQSILDTRE